MGCSARGSADAHLPVRHAACQDIQALNERPPAQALHRLPEGLRPHAMHAADRISRGLAERHAACEVFPSWQSKYAREGHVPLSAHMTCAAMLA